MLAPLAVLMLLPEPADELLVLLLLLLSLLVLMLSSLGQRGKEGGASPSFRARQVDPLMLMIDNVGMRWWFGEQELPLYRSSIWDTNMLQQDAPAAAHGGNEHVVTSNERSQAGCWCCIGGHASHSPGKSRRRWQYCWSVSRERIDASQHH